MGAGVVSMSFGLNGITAADDSHFASSTAGFVSGEGDHGCPYLRYPAASPDVLSVGGTALDVSGAETGWSDSGGGVTAEPRPGYQVGWRPRSTVK